MKIDLMTTKDAAATLSVVSVEYVRENMYMAPDYGRVIEFSDGTAKYYPNQPALCELDDENQYDVAYAAW